MIVTCLFFLVTVLCWKKFRDQSETVSKCLSGLISPDAQDKNDVMRVLSYNVYCAESEIMLRWLVVTSAFTTLTLTSMILTIWFWAFPLG